MQSGDSLTLFALANAYLGWPGRVLMFCAWTAYAGWFFGTHGAGFPLAKVLAGGALIGFSLPVVIVWIVSQGEG